MSGRAEQKRRAFHVQTELAAAQAEAASLRALLVRWRPFIVYLSPIGEYVISAPIGLGFLSNPETQEVLRLLVADTDEALKEEK